MCKEHSCTHMHTNTDSVTSHSSTSSSSRLPLRHFLPCRSPHHLRQQQQHVVTQQQQEQRQQHPHQQQQLQQ